jgi:acyl carrier protein
MAGGLSRPGGHNPPSRVFGTAAAPPKDPIHQQYPGLRGIGHGSAPRGGGGGRGRQETGTDNMSSTFETVAQVISETSELPLEEITPDAHAIDDLGIDSLDFLDIVFALDKKFGIKIPLEAWTQEVNAGRASVDDYFVLKNLSSRIDELVAAKKA